MKTWNPDDPQSIRQAAEGIETIIYLVGVNYWEFQLHPVLMQRTINGAIASGVQRIPTAMCNDLSYPWDSLGTHCAD
jgi:hypothetical protein